MIDLANLAGEWLFREVAIPLTVNAQEIMPASPRRFAVIMCLIATDGVLPPNTNLAILSTNDQAATSGLILKVFDIVRFDFSHSAVFVQQRWFARRSGADPNAVLMVWEISQSANPDK